MNGLGLSFQFSSHQSMRSVSSATDVKLVLVSALRVSTENQASIRFNHDDEVAVKWQVPVATSPICRPRGCPKPRGVLGRQDEQVDELADCRHIRHGASWRHEALHRSRHSSLRTDRGFRFGGSHGSWCRPDPGSLARRLGRSNAWTWVFSSNANSAAAWGGFR